MSCYYGNSNASNPNPLPSEPLLEETNQHLTANQKAGLYQDISATGDEQTFKGRKVLRRAFFIQRRFPERPLV